MKIICLFILSTVILSASNMRLKEGAESTCQYEFFYYPTPAISTTSSGVYVVPVTISSQPKYFYTTSTYIPITVLSLRQGDKSYRISAVDEAANKMIKVKGDLFEKDKNGIQWFTHDRTDKNNEEFKKGVARCQTMYRELSSRKAFRTKEFESKTKLESDLFEVLTKKLESTEQNVSLKKTDSANKIETAKVEAKVETSSKKEEVKISTIPNKNVSSLPKITEKANPKVEVKKDKTVNKTEDVTKPAVKNEVEVIPKTVLDNKIGINSRFVEKKEEFENGDDDLEKLKGESKEKKTENKILVEKAKASANKELSGGKSEVESESGDELLEEDTNNSNDKYEADKTGNEEGNGDAVENEEEDKDDIEEEIPNEEDSELEDDENSADDQEDTETVTDMEEEDFVEEQNQN